MCAGVDVYVEGMEDGWVMWAGVIDAHFYLKYLTTSYILDIKNK